MATIKLFYYAMGCEDCGEWGYYARNKKFCDICSGQLNKQDKEPFVRYRLRREPDCE